MDAKDGIVCLSHKADVDGLGSAALVRMAVRAGTVLADYGNQITKLKKIAADTSLESLYICDLGLNKSNKKEFIDIIRNLRKNGVQVTYIDHHKIDMDSYESLVECGVKMIYDEKECAAILAFNEFKDILPEKSSILAACASLMDYTDKEPMAVKIINEYDRQFLMINASVLAFDISAHQHDVDYLLYMVSRLADLILPHNMPESFETARVESKKRADIMDYVRSNYEVLDNVAYIEIVDSSASAAVNFALGISDKPIAVAYRKQKDDINCAMSIRTVDSCKIKLGPIVDRLCSSLGGNGGGHDNACGGKIPYAEMTNFLRMLNDEL